MHHNARNSGAGTWTPLLPDIYPLRTFFIPNVHNRLRNIRLRLPIERHSLTPHLLPLPLHLYRILLFESTQTLLKNKQHILFQTRGHGDETRSEVGDVDGKDVV